MTLAAATASRPRWRATVPSWRACVVVVAVVVAATAGCGGVRPRVSATPNITERRIAAALHTSELPVHLASMRPLRRPALVLYASGDGGWFGTAIDMWRLVAHEGVAAAGFSARAFLRIERARDARLDPAQLAREYRAIVAAATPALGLAPDVPVILAGWSRGAAFAVLAAAEPLAVPHLAGVIAIGLDATEDLAVDGPGDESDDGAAPAATTPGAHLFHPYRRLRRVPVPVAVIQATHDDYLPAASARALFGPDSPTRRFITVEARNHRFAGGTAALDQALGDAVRWLSASASSGGGVS